MCWQSSPIPYPLGIVHARALVGVINLTLPGGVRGGAATTGVHALRAPGRWSPLPHAWAGLYFVPMFLALQEARHSAGALDNPALTFALALGAGVIAQTIAHHVRLPGIVLFLAVGVLLGPDGANLVRPDTLGNGLNTLVGLAVAVILFEGGLNLNVTRLRRQAVTIRRLVTVGALITAAGGTLAAKLFMGWEWRVAVIFGTLVIVTGPTVIAPLVRRIRVKPKLQTILEGEGVLIDPIGAIIAVVTLEVVLAQTAGSAALSLLGIPTRLLVGAALGAAAGIGLAFVLRHERIVPDDLRNVFTLALVLTGYAISEAVVPESGIMMAPVAGLVVGNTQVRLHAELTEFKEQLTIMFVGMLFVLLAADVRLFQVAALGSGAAWTIAALMLVVRPLNVAVSTRRTDLSVKERAFIAWIGPRGIVAAAVASLFAQLLADEGVAGGLELRALVFLVIAVTVVVQGLTGGPLASVLALRRPMNNGYVIVGANALGRLLARALKGGTNEVVLVDSNAQETRRAEEEGFTVIFGNAHDERTLLRADAEGRRGLIAVTGNEGVNLLIANRARDAVPNRLQWVAVERGTAGVTPAQVVGQGHRVLFGQAVGLARWVRSASNDDVEVSRWRFAGTGDERAGTELITGKRQAEAKLLPLVVERRNRTEPVDDRTTVGPGNVVQFLSLKEQESAVRERLGAGGWVPAEQAVATA